MRLIAALDRLEDLREELIAELDILEGDADLEPGSDDEGFECDREIEDGHAVPSYAADDLDQSRFASGNPNLYVLTDRR